MFLRSSVFAWVVCTSFLLPAGEVTMKSGHTITFQDQPVPVQGLNLAGIRAAPKGPVPGYPFTVFNTGPCRYYLSQSQVQEIQLGDPNYDEFELTQLPSPRVKAFEAIGTFLDVTPFSEHSRRIITLRSPDGEVPVIQSIKKLRPDYVELSALKHDWEYAVHTSELPIPAIRQAISQSIDEQSQQDRFAVVRFFIDAEMYREAQQELDRMRPQFTDLGARIDELQLQIRQLRGLQFQNELQRRLAAGQYELVYQQAKNFPRKDVSQSILNNVDQMVREHEIALEKIDLVHARLAALQGEITDDYQLNRFRDMRAVISQRLSRHNLERFAPFLQNADDDFLSAAEKLALAYSAWVVGPAMAETDPDTAINYWNTREIVQSYLRSDNPLEKEELITQLKQTEGVGPEMMEALMKQFGPLYETPAYQVGQQISMQTLDSDGISYQILLPVEYSPDRSYPVIIALASGEELMSRELAWWGGETLAGPAHRNGMIVISPDFLGNEGALAVGSSSSHLRVVNVLRDARKRFAADSEQVFLAGHGLGADAAIDIGMAHPDLFAGTVSIGGRTNEYATQCWKNFDSLPLYMVLGELDGKKFDDNAGDLTRMMRNRFDIVLAQYLQRGNEDYREELPKILDWMKLHYRAPLPREFETQTMRESNNRFFWLEFSGLPQAVIQPQINSSGRAIPARAIPVEGQITEGNSMYLKLAAEHISIWLSPDLVDFNERLKIRWKSRTIFNDFPERNIETMLQHVDVTGDRQRLFWMRVDQ